MPAPTRPPRAAVRVLHRLAVLLLTAGLLVALAPGASGSGDRPERWVGYGIPATGHAAGGWIGGYRVGSTTVYLTTPTRRPNRSGFRDPRRVGDLAGKAASRSETERAAWILSKYGGYKDATQAAAVDASVYHLLVGGRWHIGARRGAQRIRQSGDPASVRGFARFMLRQSRQSAGAYTAHVEASGADLGGTVAVTLGVRDGHGRPAPGLPVTLAMGGAEPATAVTGDDGRAVARFAADARGWQDVTATVRNVPEHRLLLLSPRREHQAAAAEGGARRTLVVSAQAAVRGPQTLSLAADPAQLLVGQSTRVVATVGGDTASRRATATLLGPFASPALAGCTGQPVGAVSGAVSSDGGYPLPAMTVTGGGYYAWRVAVDGTATSVPVASCGATTKVRGRAAVEVASDVDVAQPGEVGATATVSGLPFPDQVTLVGTLSGPYASPQAVTIDGCATVLDQTTRLRTGNGSVHFTLGVVQPGWYGWQVQASPGDLWLGARSTCGAGASLLGVVQ